MKKQWLLFVNLVVSFALVGTIGYIWGKGFDPEVQASPISALHCEKGEIRVSGEGRVSVVPDIAILNLGVEAQATWVIKAKGQAAEAMERVTIALKENGVAERDIQTYRFSISPVRKWDKVEEKEKLIGFRVTNMVRVKIRKIDEAGPVIDAVAEAGGDFIRIEGISFIIEDPKPYYAKAREEAMLDARSKAEQLAELGEVILGKPTYIAESIGTYAPQRLIELREKGAAAPTPISPGELEVTIKVEVHYLTYPVIK